MFFHFLKICPIFFFNSSLWALMQGGAWFPRPVFRLGKQSWFSNYDVQSHVIIKILSSLSGWGSPSSSSGCRGRRTAVVFFLGFGSCFDGFHPDKPLRLEILVGFGILRNIWVSLGEHTLSGGNLSREVGKLVLFLPLIPESIIPFFNIISTDNCQSLCGIYFIYI